MSQDVQTIRISEYVRLDKRQRGAKWQARVKLADGSWHRFSTKTEDVERATDLAMKFFLHRRGSRQEQPTPEHPQV